MDMVSTALNQTVEFIAKIGISLIELAGILILFITAIQGLIGYFRRDPHVRLHLAEGISLALEFKLGGEVLRTVIVRDLNELFILGAIVLLRAALALLLHWEINIEKNRELDQLMRNNPVSM